MMWTLLVQYLLLIFASVVIFNSGENNVQKDINETKLVPDTHLIDLRNKLDIMTEELLSKGHAYVLNSGTGNREVLKVISVERRDEFVGGKEVTEWQSVRSGGRVYLLGKRPTGFVLLESHYRHENKTVEITEYEPDFPSGRKITTMAMIERWNATIKSNEVIILLAVNSSTADIIWYRLQNNKVVPFWSWSHYKEVSTVLLFSIGKQYKMLVVNANDGKYSTTAEVYDIVFEQSHSDFSLTHTLALNESSSSAAVTTIGENVFLFVTQKQKGHVLIYKYKYFMSEQYESGHFELHTILSAPGVTQVVTFHTAYQNYVAFNGNESQIYRIKNSGEFNKEATFGHIRQWVVLPVHNYRSEVILFARELDQTKVYAWAGDDNGFSEISLPLCHEKLSADSCFSGIKDGTASLLLYNFPSLIIPAYPNNSIIYHFTTPLQPIKTPIYKYVNSLNRKKNFLETRLEVLSPLCQCCDLSGDLTLMKRKQHLRSRLFKTDLWKIQKQNISAIRKSLQYILRNDANNIVKENWILGNLTTSNLINTSSLKCSKLGFLTQNSEIYKFVDLDNLESKVDLVKKKLSELGDYIRSTVDLTKFNGVLFVKGHTVIESLAVSVINKFSVDGLLNDTLSCLVCQDATVKKNKRTEDGTLILKRPSPIPIRSDMPKRIVGQKIIRSLKADEITFSKIKNITASELTYSDNVITINGNLNIDKPLQVDKDVILIEKGTVNKVDLSEDICRVDVECRGIPIFDSLVVDDITVHKKINGDSLLPPHNQTDRSKFNRVFGGHGLTVLSINGRNWSDLANSVVYKDQDSYVTGHTTINGALYSRHNVKIETLNGLRFPDDYAIMSRTSQKVTGRKYFEFPMKKTEQPSFRSHSNKVITDPVEANNDKSFIEPKASVRSRVTELEELMLDDFSDWLKNVDIIFSDAEVTGVVSSSVQSNWTNVAADIVHKDEVSSDITSQKTFLKSLKIKNNLELSGLIGNKNISDLLTTDSEQIVEGVSNLHGHTTFNNVTINGEWDGVRIETLLNDSVKLSDNQALPDLQLMFISDKIHDSEVETRNLTVSQSVNNVTIHEIEKAMKNYILLFFQQPIVLNGSLNAVSVSVLGNITLNGKICGWNLANYSSMRFSLSKSEDIIGNISILSANVTDDLHVESINGMKVSDLQDYLNMDKMNSVNKDVEITALYVHGNISSKQGVSHLYNITSIVQHAVWLQNNNYINSSLTFVDEVVCGMMNIHGLVSEQDWNVFAQNVVYKSDAVVTLRGRKTFPSGFGVYGNLDVEKINGHYFEEIITKTSEQVVEGEVIITGNISIESIDDISGTLNEVDVAELSKQCTLVYNGEVKCEGNVAFATDINIQELQVDGAVNEVNNFTEFVNTLLFKNLSGHIVSEAVFSGDTKFSGSVKIRSHINNIDWNEFTDNVALINETNYIKEPVTFSKELKVSNKLSVNGELSASTVNGYNLTEWAENAMYLNSPLNVMGEKCFTDIISTGNISIEWFDKVHMMNIITLNHKDTIFGVFNFRNVTAADLQVYFKVNDMRLDEEYGNTLLSDGKQVIESNLSFLDELSIKGNLTARGLINKQNISDAATVHKNETLYGKYYFNCSQLHNNLTTEGRLSGINITNWKESAILFDKDHTVEGAVTVLGNITFTRPVIGAKSLGGTDLEELSNFVQQNILDIQQNMKDNLTKACGITEHLVQKARTQEMSIQYFEQSQLTDSSENNIYRVHHFQDFVDDFVSVTRSNCITDIYQWNRTSAQFKKVFAVNMGRYITHWATLACNNQTYIVTRSPIMVDDKCPYSGTNLWLFNNSTIDHVNKLNEKVDAVMTDGNKKNQFYTLNDKSVTEWKVNHTSRTLEFVRNLPKTLENATFVSPASGLGLSITNGNKIVPVLPDNKLLVNISINCTSEKAEYSRDKQQDFLAVAAWEETQIHRYSDFIKIYTKDGILFDKLTSWKPSHLNWLSLPGQSWLTFIENSTGLQIYSYQGPNEGFKQELSVDVNVTGLLTMALHVNDKLNTQPYILIYSNISLYLLKPKVLGDPYIGPNVSCHYNDWHKIV